MVIEIDDWRFHVFGVTARKYYARELADHCTCAWCRNFYQSVDQKYPGIRPFLNRFEVQMDAPTEMMAFGPTMCANYYAVSGSILKRGEGPIVIDSVSIEPLEQDECNINIEEEWPVFFLYVGCMSLPWVLEEPMEKADSPAKGKNFVQRLLQRWITEE